MGGTTIVMAKWMKTVLRLPWDVNHTQEEDGPVWTTQIVPMETLVVMAAADRPMGAPVTIRLTTVLAKVIWTVTVILPVSMETVL